MAKAAKVNASLLVGSNSIVLQIFKNARVNWLGRFFLVDFVVLIGIQDTRPNRSKHLSASLRM